MLLHVRGMLHAVREPDPSVDALVGELRKWFQRGFFRVRWWEQVPTLAHLAMAQPLADQTFLGDRIEAMLREAAQKLDAGGPYSTAAACLFALDPKDRSLSLGVRRAKAAAVFSIEPDSFRRRREDEIIDALARRLQDIADAAA